MEEHVRRGCGDVAAMHVKTEASDENALALVAGSHAPPAPRGDAACRGAGGGGGGGGGGAERTAEELDDTASAPVLLYPVGTDRFFTTSGDGKTYLKIAPASVMPPAPPEKMLPSGSDFSSKAVLCLIEAVGRRWGLYETRERSQLFQSVQEEMATKGHMLPVEKIRRKWNNLIVTYKRVKDRSRETGHAKTSWEFFDLMDATLCDTVGSQIISNKRIKAGGTASGSTPAKAGAKPQLPQPSAAGTSRQPDAGDFGAASCVDSLGQIISTSAAITSGNLGSTSSSELKPLIVLNGGNAVPPSVHPTSVVPSPSFISSPCLTEPPSTSTSLCLTGPTDPNTSGHVGHKAPPAVVPFRLSTTPPSNHQNLLSLSSSVPPAFSCLSSAVASSSSAATPGTDGQRRRVNAEQGGPGPVCQDRVARRRVEAREKRRERREVRMAESLGRIATALELLSSKQDTVIALLQRLADRK